MNCAFCPSWFYFGLPATPSRLSVPCKPDQSGMTSTYLDRPLIPLTVALPRLLENIEAELASEKLEASEQRRLRRRAELIHWLLTPRTIK